MVAKAWHGRIFIKGYYAIGPSVVNRFGKTQWLKKVSRRVLDKFVDKLYKSGIEKTPYQDNQ